MVTIDNVTRINLRADIRVLLEQDLGPFVSNFDQINALTIGQKLNYVDNRHGLGTIGVTVTRRQGADYVVDIS